MLREAQFDQVLVTGSKASQFFRPFWPQGSDPPTTYSLLFREQTPAGGGEGGGATDVEPLPEREATRSFVRSLGPSVRLTCVAAVRPQFRHLDPLVGLRVVPLSAAQLVGMSVGAPDHVQLALCEVVA